MTATKPRPRLRPFAVTMITPSHPDRTWTMQVQAESAEDAMNTATSCMHRDCADDYPISAKEVQR